MIEQYIDVIRDDIYRLFCKRGRASDAEYLLILKRLDILKKEVINDTWDTSTSAYSRLSDAVGTTTTKET